jgi:hypothetical protein
MLQNSDAKWTYQVTTQRKKQHGNEKMTFEKTTRTYLQANPNLEGEIHLKGVRLVTSQNLNKLQFAYMHSYHLFFAQKSLSLPHYPFWTNYFPVMFMTTGEFFYKIPNWFESI